MGAPQITEEPLPRIDFDAERRETRVTSEVLELVIAGHVLQLNPGGVHPDVLTESEHLNDLLHERSEIIAPGSTPTPDQIREVSRKIAETLALADRIMLLLLAPGSEEEWSAVRAETGEDQVTLDDLVTLIGRMLSEVSARPLESSVSPPSSIETPSSTTVSTESSGSPAGAAFPTRALSEAS